MLSSRCICLFLLWTLALFLKNSCQEGDPIGSPLTCIAGKEPHPTAGPMCHLSTAGEMRKCFWASCLCNLQVGIQQMCWGRNPTTLDFFTPFSHLSVPSSSHTGAHAERGDYLKWQKKLAMLFLRVRYHRCNCLFCVGHGKIRDFKTVHLTSAWSDLEKGCANNRHRKA